MKLEAIKNGIRNVQREIIEMVCGRGAQLNASDFVWNHGRPLEELAASASVHMAVRRASSSAPATAEWTQAELEDSSNLMKRVGAMRQQLDRIIEQLAPSLIRNPGGFGVK